MTTQKGMTFLEIMFAMAIMSIVTLGLVAAFLSESTANELTSMETLANNAAQEMIEEVIGMAKQYDDLDGSHPTDTDCVQHTIGGITYRFIYLDGMIVSYTQTFTDPYGNPIDRSSFDVEGLEPVTGETDVGRVILHLDETRIPVELGGDGTAATAVVEDGMTFGPMDLNGDGQFTDLSTPLSAGFAPASTDRIGIYKTNLVPVEVRIKWDLRPGEITMRRFAMVARTLR